MLGFAPLASLPLASLPQGGEALASVAFDLWFTLSQADATVFWAGDVANLTVSLPFFVSTTSARNPAWTPDTQPNDNWTPRKEPNDKWSPHNQPTSVWASRAEPSDIWVPRDDDADTWTPRI